MSENEEILRRLKEQGLIDYTDFDELIKDVEVVQIKKIKDAKNALPVDIGGLNFA